MQNSKQLQVVLDYQQKALTISKKVLGTKHPDTALYYNNIGFLYESKGDYNTALNFYKKSLIILKKVLTLQHPTTKTVFNNYRYVLNEAAKAGHSDSILAHIAFIQAEFSDYLD